MKPVIAKRGLWVSLLAGAALGLLACNPPDPLDPKVETTVAPKVEAKAEAKDAEPAPRNVTTQAKPSAPVQLDYEIADTPAVGRPTEIELTFRSSESGAPVRADFRIADPAALSFIELPPDAAPIAMEKWRGGSVGHYRLRVMPHRKGRHVINVLANIDTNIGQLSRSMAIAVDVPGNGAQEKQEPVSDQAPEPEVRMDSNGEAIIPMPARESRQ